MTDQLPKGQSVTTWADAFGTWHARVTVDKIGNAPGVLDTARAAIAAELIERGNAATATYVASEGYRVDYVPADGEPTRTPDGIVYEFVEVAPE